MGVGSYLAKFIKGNLIDKFVEIEILVGIVGGISSVVLFILFNTMAHLKPFFIFLFLYRMSGRGGNPLLMNILKDRIGSKIWFQMYLPLIISGHSWLPSCFHWYLIPNLGIVKTHCSLG
jgi:spermidine synthase